MKIDGKAIAQIILDNLSKRVKELKKRGVNPHLVIILVGDDPASAAYVRQKELKAKEIGAKVTILRLPMSITSDKLLKLLNKLNPDHEVNGVIVQRPLPPHIDHETIALAVDPKKDVDGLHPDSPFPMPLALAVSKILQQVARLQGDALRGWERKKKIVIIGKGKTAGGPVIDMLKKQGVEPVIIDSKTLNPQAKTKNADIIITSVGKSNIVTKDMVKKDVILISVGLYRGKDGKLHGDYEEEEIENIASFYTPTPGGVGPVNVAMLLENLVVAANSSLT